MANVPRRQKFYLLNSFECLLFLARMKKTPQLTVSPSLSHVQRQKCISGKQNQGALNKERAVIAREAKIVIFSTLVLSNFNIYMYSLRMLLK